MLVGMSSTRAVIRKKWGVRHWLGLSIAFTSLLLSFLLISCSNNDPPLNSSAGNQLNVPLRQVVVTNTIAPVQPQADTVLVVVAARVIPVGTQISRDDITSIPKPRGQVVLNQDILSEFDALNRINKVAYNPGQQLKQGDLIEGSFSSYMRQLVADKRLEPGKFAFAYPTNDLASVSNLIQENDLIDVIATYYLERRNNEPDGTGVTAGYELSTKTILQNVRVLKVVRLQARPPEVVQSTATPAAGAADTPSPVAVAPSTPTPTPTLPVFLESGTGFTVNTILILGVTDQEAEVLKFTREYRTLGGARLTNPFNNEAPPPIPLVPGLPSNLSDTSIVHFVLRPKPQDPANPIDPAVARQATTGVTFRVLVRDYGLPIPELIFVTGTN